jgi:hypothetical protein
MSSFEIGQENNTIPVVVRPFGQMIKLSTVDSNKYVGIVTLPVLAKVLDEFRIKFTATLTMSLPEPCKKNVQAKVKDKIRSRECSLRLVVQGLKCEQSAVGTLLSESGLYFQQPFASECDGSLEYSNPHYLLRPGSKMPTLDEPVLSPDVSNLKSSETFDEVARSRFMRLFDLANDTFRPKIIASPRLRSTMKE